ncbi:MAG: beta-ketoacyl synthase chain length factor [Planctomycetes bacterium]|nr:beta-ketoacyl synthase chain length factor [Planctomycetota bacterium]
MSPFSVAVTGVGLYLPGFLTAQAWTSGEALPADQPQKPTGLAFDRVNRRRASQMGRAIADVVHEALAQAGADPVTTPVIVGSSIGEASAMIGLLDQMWREKEPMSPAVFTVSVHNAASGLLSISAKNKGYTTSIAADYDTPAAVLLEAIGLIATGHERVAVVCADEASPRSLLEHAPHWEMLAAALVLSRSDDPAALAQVTVAAAPDDTRPDAATMPQWPEGIEHNPQVGLADLADAVLRRRAGALALDRGKGRGFAVTLSPVAATGAAGA